jgi:L-asparaginase
VKFHTTDLDTFAAPYATSIGRIEKGSLQYNSNQAPKNPPVALTGLTARVALVPMVVGDDGQLLELARSGHDGVVVVAFGSGNVPPGAVPAIGRWINDGKPVVIATRCPTGVVEPMYAFDGGGSRLVKMGAIPAGPRSPAHARMELTIALSAGVPYGS